MKLHVTKIKKGIISLPKVLRSTWENAEVLVSSAHDTLTIKKVMEPTLTDLKPTLKILGNQVSQKEIDQEVECVRRKNI